ncbi:MAG: hypothetical protein JW880_01150 [Candidatus Thermoplasmatota archaeon]|nr:hypothetical protein [Candidatus Thermoplasmatota archaeon]
MSEQLSPGLERDLVAARAALARHGIVIIRTIETELEPAVMAAVRRVVASSGRKLSKLDDDALDELMDDARKAVRSFSRDLQRLYTRLLAKLGTEDVGRLVSELEGIDQLFRWERVARTSETVNSVLAKRGFEAIELFGPEDLSDAFKLELEERWPAAFSRLKDLAEAAAKELTEKGEKGASRRLATQTKRRKR